MAYRLVTRCLFTVACLTGAAALSGCDGGETAAPEPSAFSLKFTATDGEKEVGCNDAVSGLGVDGKQVVGLADLRFYVSNLRFTDSEGGAVALELDQNEFQYESAAGSVALVDLTGNDEGSCASSAITFAEGTKRTNTAIAGKTVVEDVASVSFDVGVPQAVMKETIANNTPEGSPSPLNEMFWSWASGYRHFVFNFTVEDGAGETGEGYMHLGSRDCGPDDGLALEDRSACGFVNTPSVSLADFDLQSGKVSVDLRSVLDGLDFIAPVYDLMTFEVIGEGPGVECHSSPMQPDCTPIFERFGLDMSTGAASSAADKAFSAR